MNIKNKFSIKFLAKYFILLGLIFSFSCSNDESQTVTTMNELVWADEFTIDGTPDSSKWNFDIGTGQNGWGNNELQYYTDRLQNIQV
jgi:hypothetical protein